MSSIVSIAALLLAAVVFIAMSCPTGSVASSIHPSLFPMRLRKGAAYQEAVARHAANSQAAAASAGSGTSSSSSIKAQEATLTPNTTYQWFDQLENHFDGSSKTFKQRYWMDLGNYSGNKIAQIYISGEGPVGESPTGYAQQYGYSIGSAIFTLEHRYYGESLPTNLTDKEGLKAYLNVDEALADLIAFIEFAEREYLGATSEDEITWYAVGGSYAGALSSWIRLKYPEKISAAWSSSGVINARFNYYEFDGHVESVIAETCSNSIRLAYGLMEAQFKDVSTRKALLQKLGTPEYFTLEDTMWMAADALAQMVQYGYKSYLCNTMVPIPADPIGKFVEIVNKLWGPDFTSNCYYSTTCLSNQEYSDQWAAAGYAWVWQCCRELAYWQTGYPHSLRSSAILSDYFVYQCRSAYFPNMISNSFYFNYNYLGAKTNATKVVATQGSDDPWQTAGVTSSPGPEYPVYYAQCNDCGHCGDLSSPASDDPSELTLQRQLVASSLTQFIQEAKQAKSTE